MDIRLGEYDLPVWQRYDSSHRPRTTISQYELSARRMWDAEPKVWPYTVLLAIRRIAMPLRQFNLTWIHTNWHWFWATKYAREQRLNQPKTSVCCFPRISLQLHLNAHVSVTPNRRGAANYYSIDKSKQKPIDPATRVNCNSFEFWKFNGLLWP